MKLEHSLHTIYKNKLKVVWRPKYKTWHYKNPRREHRQNILRHKSQQSFLRSVCQDKRKQSINKQTGPNQIQKFCTAGKP